MFPGFVDAYISKIYFCPIFLLSKFVEMQKKIGPPESKVDEAGNFVFFFARAIFFCYENLLIVFVIFNLKHLFLSATTSLIHE